MASTMEIQYLPPGSYSLVLELHPGSLSVHRAGMGSLYSIKIYFEGTSTSLIRDAATVLQTEMILIINIFICYWLFHEWGHEYIIIDDDCQYWLFNKKK